ncbi:hypothetical protein SASPL_153601 [Salvia splendens]|uniref:JmjC domain-containing protein n=1 Tax=Salvia splendens TaxID=180675 RepID=A0A8X8VYL4_SALSN|nr:hypothetical protein SASPL_153601 [Salvia splendens]
MGLKIGGEVEKVNGKELTYAEFVEKYLDRNQPIILTGLTDDWRACRDWVSGDGKPNLRFFSDQFGSSRVQVADCATREFSDQKRLEMSVSEFIQLWISSSSSDNGAADGKPLLYLKDWHFVRVCLREYPDYVAYSTPVFFLDDWLNLYLDKHHMHVDPESYQERNEVNCSDYRFVYMGAKGTWTPLHADVFRSYSWSANVCGRKQWYFLSPSQHHLVFDRQSGWNALRNDMKLSSGTIKFIIWYSIEALSYIEDTISINHNWFNGYNISWVWDLLLREYHEAAGYIEDLKECDEFEELCHRNLAANASSRSFLFNLKNIKCITLKMKSEAEWQNWGIAATDLAETIEEQSFMDFCDSLERTCSMIYNHSGIDFSPFRTLLDHEQTSVLYPHGSHIRNLDDLITFLDHAFKLVGSES